MKLPLMILYLGKLLFGVDENHFENGTFRKRWHRDHHVIFLTEFSSNTRPK